MIMALPTNNTIINPWDVITPPNVTSIGSGSSATITASNWAHNQKEYAIQGQLYTTEFRVNDYSTIILDPDDVKRRLISQLVDELFAKNAIEFTKAQDMSQNAAVFRARIYAVPDTQVRILRENPR
jgi:hypothetical protein